MSDFISISDARADLPNLINKISKNMDRVTITVNGKPKAIVLSPEELESLEETAEVLAIPHILEDLEKSRKQIKEGKLVPFSSLKNLR